MSLADSSLGRGIAAGRLVERSEYQLEKLATERRRGPVAVGLKRCLMCRAPKPLANFDGDCTRRDGLYPYCKVCRKVIRHRWYWENGGRARALDYNGRPKQRAYDRERQRRKWADPEQREIERMRCRAYRSTPMGRLVVNRNGAKRRLRRAKERGAAPELIAGIAATLAAYEAEIERLRARGEV